MGVWVCEWVWVCGCVYVKGRAVFPTFRIAMLYDDKGMITAVPSPSPILELNCCVKYEVAGLGSPSPISLMVSVDVKQHRNILSCQSSGAV